MGDVVLSVLMPALTSRNWEKLHTELMKQVKLCDHKVQVLVELDSGESSSGLKRQKLMEQASGKYICYVDDDDRVSPSYVSSLVEGCLSGTDVVTFNLQMKNARKQNEIWKFGLNGNDRKNGRMCVNHLCAWKKSIASRVAWVPELGYWDDHFWFEPLFYAGLVRTQFHVDRVLYYYDYDANITVNQRRERILITKNYAAPNGVPCFSNCEGQIFMGDGGKCMVDEETVRVRNNQNDVLTISTSQLFCYHTVKVF